MYRQHLYYEFGLHPIVHGIKSVNYQNFPFTAFINLFIPYVVYNTATKQVLVC